MADKILNGDLLINGDLSATNLYGDGSGLTGITVGNIPTATQSQNGLMSASDKRVIDSLNPNVSVTISDINASEYHIINAKEDDVLNMVIAAEPIIEAQIRTNNLLDINTTFGNYYISATGAITGSAPDMLGDFMPVTPGQDIYYTGHVGETSASSVNRRLHVYTADKTWIKQISFAGSLRVGQNWSTHGTVPSNGAYVRVSWGITDTNLMVSVGAPTEYQPYYITPFDAITEVNYKISPTSDPEDADEYTFTVPASAGAQYGFIFNPITGMLTQVAGHIASYNGETLPGHWQSDRDVYVEGGTPSIGAEVIYRLDEEDYVEYDCDNGIDIPLNYRINYFFIENGLLSEITYYAETVAMQHITIYSGATFGTTDILEEDVQGWNHAAELIDTKADLVGPSFTGNATAPTLTITNNSDRIATTAFVQSQMHNLAPYEASAKASRDYNAGDYLTYAGYLYKATAAIARNTNLTVGTNIEATDVATELNLLRSLIQP